MNLNFSNYNFRISLTNLISLILPFSQNYGLKPCESVTCSKQ